MLQENSLGFADVLSRDRLLIVDALLQHVGRRGTGNTNVPLGVANMIAGVRELRQSALPSPGKGHDLKFNA
jgi:hypothetical protein